VSSVVAGLEKINRCEGLVCEAGAGVAEPGQPCGC
jgi:hypothetical protein